jgi:septal ring factor EnvC (AmiA/AmiB activator)
VKGEKIMKQLRRSLNAISKNLKELTIRTSKLVKALDKLEKAQAKADKTKKGVAKRAGAKRAVSRKATTMRTAAKKPAKRKVPAKKGKSISATETVLKIVKRSRKGIDTATIQKKTGYNTRKIWDIVHRAYKEGKINKVGRGTYVKA